ncbi:uncharacterized protein EI90DRAFT_3125172 [Cantharellus anzutake]|uniref:uncharacterized protein n=1 Tax=Cantharellus anzutake TaxID=1750568 RepID=UPI001904483A|nr:uncharacterized protein EI90DRAFT_3125172 [Cantharellus anzutake]KAF8329389.1 hypothetical protein EI90DRAFT_3125172 [Cantharellus anzutake]
MDQDMVTDPPPSRTSIDSTMSGSSLAESVASVLSSYSSSSIDTDGLQTLLDNARELVSTYIGGELVPSSKEVKADLLLTSLMDYAVKDKGKHYVATAILACEKHQLPKGFLLALAEFWLTFLICPVASAKRRDTPSTEQTPTVHDTAALIQTASRGDQKALRDLVHPIFLQCHPTS